jgi:hypothetical protein
VNKDAAWYYPDPKSAGVVDRGLGGVLARRDGRA